jgi:hypothetical protein
MKLAAHLPPRSGTLLCGLLWIASSCGPIEPPVTATIHETDMVVKLWLATERQSYHADEPVVVQLFALNDGFRPADLDRLMLIGPNPVVERPAGTPIPVSVEPSVEPADRNLITLNPFCIYGRQRVFDHLPAGTVVFHGYLLRARSQQLLADRPVDAALLAAAAKPLTVVIEDAGPANR